MIWFYMSWKKKLNEKIDNKIKIFLDLSEKLFEQPLYG